MFQNCRKYIKENEEIIAKINEKRTDDYVAK